MHTTEYLEDIAQRIAAAVSEDDTATLQSTGRELEQSLTVLNGIYDALAVGAEITMPLDEQITEWIHTVQAEIKRCEREVDFINEEIEEERLYGSYPDQVRQTYIGGIL